LEVVFIPVGGGGTYFGEDSGVSELAEAEFVELVAVFLQSVYS
jgi:hypothetical protein